MDSLNINILTSAGIKGAKVALDGDIVASLETSDKRMDSTRVLLPSFIDMHVHLRDFDQRDKETVASGSRAALAGGASAVCDMPNTSPPVDDAEAFNARRRLLSNDSCCDFLINYCVHDRDSLEDAARVDPFFIKLYLEETTGSLILEDGLLEDVFKLGIPVAMHSHADGVRQGIKCSKKYNTPLHICHVATKEVLDLLSANKDENITCEVTPHHLFLSGDYDVRPPLSCERDRRALWAALGSTIDIVASDHAPHTAGDKSSGAFGVSGVETLLPLMFTALNRRRISSADFHRCMHANQVRILGRLGRRFGFSVGGRADFTIIDTAKKRAIDPSKFLSKAKHSPFDGMEVDASVSETWVRGKPFFIDGKFPEWSRGEEIKKYEL